MGGVEVIGVEGWSFRQANVAIYIYVYSSQFTGESCAPLPVSLLYHARFRLAHVSGYLFMTSFISL